MERVIKLTFGTEGRISFQRSLGLGSLMVASVMLVLAAGPAAADERASEQMDEAVTCLALNIYFEARSEPVEGKLAVGHVVMNRVAHPRFPKSVCKVVRQGGERRRYRCQFTWWCDGRSDRPRNRVAWQQSVELAYQIYVGFSEDPTRGAMWYHADYVDPRWRTDFKRGPKIGRHIFYLNGRSRGGKLRPARFAADAPSG